MGPLQPSEPSSATHLRLLFIHHSCGGELLASPGPPVGENCIRMTSPNGGGLRSRLEQEGYSVHEASYGSVVGEKTDIFDWLPKFRDRMERVLSCDSQDAVYLVSQRNDIVVFKSCFPNNEFTGPGQPPGDATGPELTVWNAKAAYSGLLEEFRKYPQTLFVCVTAPPLAPNPEPLWKRLARWVLRRPNRLPASGVLAREFNNWLSGADGWLKEYSLTNVAVFDLFDLLTDFGQSNLSRYPTCGGRDSHPSREGNAKAANAFVPFLNKVVHQWEPRRGRRDKVPT